MSLDNNSLENYDFVTDAKFLGMLPKHNHCD